VQVKQSIRYKQVKEHAVQQAQAGKITMINDMAKVWGLPAFVTPEGTLPNLENAQVRFMEVPPFSSYCPLILT